MSLAPASDGIHPLHPLPSLHPPPSHPPPPLTTGVSLAPVSVSDDDLAATADRSIVSAAGRTRASTSASTGPRASSLALVEHVSPVHCFVDVVVQLPLIAVDLHISDAHTVTLLVNSLHTHVVVRQHDLQVNASLIIALILTLNSNLSQSQPSPL